MNKNKANHPLDIFTIREIVLECIKRNLIKIAHFDKNGDVIFIVLHEGDEKITFKAKGKNNNSSRIEEIIRKMTLN